MRIVLVTIEYPPQPFSSGIGSYTQAIAQGLAGRGHTVHVLTRGTDGDRVEAQDGVTVEYVVPARAELPERLHSTLAMIALGLRGISGEIRYRRRIARRLHALVERDGYELVETADHMGEAAWYDPGRHPAVPFVVRLHTPLCYSERIERNIPAWVTAVVASQERRQARHATHLTSPSGAMVDAFMDTLRLAGRPVHVNPNPPLVALRSSSPVPNPPGAPVVLFVGRLTGWKGVDTLMRAVPQVLRRFPEARFQLVGADTGPSHGYASHRAYLESLLPDDARPNVEFVGKVAPEAMEGFYRQATVCAFPSRFDVSPYTCLEAMNFGKAIIGSCRSGMREMLDGGAAGLLHRPPDAEDLADKIVQLLDDPDLRRRLGERAFDRARSALSAEAALDATEAFYEQAIDDLHGRAIRGRPSAAAIPLGGDQLADGRGTGP